MAAKKWKNVGGTAVTLPDGRQIGVGETAAADDVGDLADTGVLVEAATKPRRKSEES